MKRALLLLSLLACERADKPPPPKPPPPKPDPVQLARAEFELVSPELAAGTSKIYARGDFLPKASVQQQFDEGDFVGRMITLFGPRDGHSWVLRDKQTGQIITAYAGASGPAYGGVLHLDDPAVQARVAADPQIATPAGGDVGDTSTWESMRIHALHLEDSQAGPELASVVRRLDAFVSQVAPADWETTRYIADEPGVYHIGAKGGVSFDDELEPHAALAFLLEMAGRTDPQNNFYDVPLTYYKAHLAALTDEKPRMVAAYRRYVELAKQARPEFRAGLLAEARQLRP